MAEPNFEMMAEAICCVVEHCVRLNGMNGYDPAQVRHCLAPKLRSAFDPAPATPEPRYETAEEAVEAIEKFYDGGFWGEEGLMDEIRKVLSRYRPCDRNAVIEECAKRAELSRGSYPKDEDLTEYGKALVSGIRHATSAVRSLKSAEGAK